MSDEGYEYFSSRLEDGRVSVQFVTPYATFSVTMDAARLILILKDRVEALATRLVGNEAAEAEALHNTLDSIIAAASVNYFKGIAPACLKALIALESTALIDAIPDQSNQSAVLRFEGSKTQALDTVNKVHHRYDKERRGIKPGRPTGRKKPAERRAQDKAAFERQIEDAYSLLLERTGLGPTKTAIAQEMGIGGRNPHTGADSRLTAFNNKLKRLGVDYEAIIQRAQLNK
jgi:hypothetical protein